MLEILISSSVLILVVALLRLVLRDKISARLQYALWLLVLVRLLVPVSFFHSPVSVAEAAAPVTERVWYASHMVIYVRNTAPVPEQALSDPSEYEEGSVVTPGQALLLRDTLLLTWYAGMVVMAAWLLLVNLRLARRLKKNRTPFDYHSVMPVYVAEGIPSPCLFGLFKPSIYLTERAAEDDTRARQIIAHELTHYRHGDMLWALLRSACLVVWWFNPLVWLAAALSRQDCELACDEGTIKALGEEARFDYGRTLVGMAAIGARPSDLLCGATTMTTGKKSLKERVARIANAPKVSVLAVILALIIAAVAVGCTYGGKADTTTIEPEIDVELPQASASASDADAEEPPKGTEPIGTYDREYWEEVDRELGSFVRSDKIETSYTPGFDPELPEDDLFGPLTSVIITYLGVDDPGFAEPVGRVIDLDCMWSPATYQPSEIRWESSDESVATVDSEGRVTTVSPGYCTVSVWVDNVSDECEVVVF